MTTRTKRILLGAAFVATIVIVAGGIWFGSIFLSGAPASGWVKVPRGSTVADIEDSIGVNIDSKFAAHVSRALALLSYSRAERAGAYHVEQGDSPLMLARRIRNRQQSPMRFTFNNVRTKQQFADRFGNKFLASSEEMLAALSDSVLVDSLGYTLDNVMCMLLPDSYEFYWTTTPRAFLERMAGVHDRFWNEQRRAKARALGLTPNEGQIICSIVEEETAKADEKPMVARLYINRLHRHIPLQADPTVKFAIGDFSIRRLTIPMTRINSPYNTYRIEGLPPGPIRVCEKATIDAALNAPEHDYIYMCAKEDFSGYHNFAADYATHQANAKRYQAALNARNIH